SRSAERGPLFLRYRSRADLSRYRYVRCDVNADMDALLALLDRERPDAIVNFAAQSEVAPSWEHPEHWFQTNTVALAQLVNHLRRRDYLKRWLHVSSPEAYGTCEGRVTEAAPFNPSTPYAASKAAADLLLSTFQRQWGFPLVTVRATNVYGARQQLFKILPRSVIYMKMGRRIPLHGGGVAVKSYIHVRDVSRGELAMLERGEVGSIYHLSPDGGIAVREAVRLIADRLGRRFEDVTTMVEERPGQDAAYVIDSMRARRELGWTPQIGMAEGLADLVDWVDANWAAIREQPLDYRHAA
ncbi:MAG: GDP-mannose 4,6-dehydratase, partial [Acidobacteriota bacterium]|nr:GDP-mannose 4,6-dehydratase [Acidobacteriota bacterium]